MGAVLWELLAFSGGGLGGDVWGFSDRAVRERPWIVREEGGRSLILRRPALEIARVEGLFAASTEVYSPSSSSESHRVWPLGGST